jgi:hypothetical protein
MTDPASAITAISHLTAAFFEAVSFPSGGRPDYERIRTLFVDRGLLVKNTGDAPEISTVDEFIAPRQQLVDSGRLTAFSETESSHSTEVFGNIAQRLSVYAKSGTQDGADFDALGVISTQFIRTPHGWRILSMIWDDEREGLTVTDVATTRT